MLGYHAGRLQLEGRDVEALASEIGAPAFVISERRLLDNLGAVRDGLDQPDLKSEIRYCAKTNSEPFVLATLAGAGAGVVASHAAEAARAISAGFSPDRISYQRPVLSDEEVATAIALGVRRFHLYAARDVYTLGRAARAARVELDVSLRLATRAPRLRLSPLRQVAARLGLGADEAVRLARSMHGSALRLTGLNFHAGTQFASPARYEPMLRLALRVARQMERELRSSPEQLNVGGGLPSPSLRVLSPLERALPVSVPMPAGDEPSRLRAFTRELGERFLALCASSGLARLPRLVVEPGRALVGNAAIALCRVHAIQGRWLYLDLTRNWVPESSFLYARALVPATEPTTRAQRFFHVSGPTLNSMDVLDVLRLLPAELRADDLLALCDAGAYTLARANRYACEAPRTYLLDAKSELRRPLPQPVPTPARARAASARGRA